MAPPATHALVIGEFGNAVTRPVVNKRVVVAAGVLTESQIAEPEITTEDLQANSDRQFFVVEFLGGCHLKGDNIQINQIVMTRDLAGADS